jgi:hypothetical protein
MVSYKRFVMASNTQKLPVLVLLYSIAIYSGVFLLFILSSWLFELNIAIAWGWLLGAFIAVINYGTILLQASRLQLRVEAKITTPYFSQGYALLRLILSAIGMLIAALWKFNDVEIFNLFSLFAAYLVISLVIYITGANFRIAKRQG